MKQSPIEPLTSWRCDVCGEMVSLSEGYVVWEDRQSEDSRFLIIHRKRCDDRRFTSSLPLDNFVGPDGLNKILGFLSGGRLLQIRYPEPHPPRVRNMDDFVEFVRRVQLPFYEEARPRFEDPEVQERLSDWTETGPYMQRTLRELAEESRNEFSGDEPGADD